MPQPPFVTKQLVPVPFQGGLDTRTDPKQVLAGNLLTLQNAVFDNPGQINKRTGYQPFPNTVEPVVDFSGITINAGVAVNVFGAENANTDELLEFDGTNIYSQLDATGNWLNKGLCISVINTNKQIVRNSAAQQLNPDVAYCNGIVVNAYEDTRSGGSVRYNVYDYKTGAIIVSDTNISSACQRPKVITFANQVIIFYQDTAGPNLYYQTVSPSTPTFLGNQVTLLTDGYTGNFAYDCCVATNSHTSQLFIGYLSDDNASGSIELLYLNGALTPSSKVSPASGTNAVNAGDTVCVNVCSDLAPNVWINWADGQNVHTSAYTFDLSSQLRADTQLDTSVACTAITGIAASSTSIQLLHQVNSATESYNTFTKSATIPTAGPVISTATIRGLGIASKLWSYGVFSYVNLTFDTSSTATNQQCTYFTCLSNNTNTNFGSNFLCVGQISSGTGGGLRTNTLLSEVPSPSTGLFLFANSIKDTFLSEGNVTFSVLGVNNTLIDYISSSSFNAVTQNNNLMIVGGIMQSYDGVSVVENNFLIFPEGIIATPSGSGGFLSAGQYQYQITYEWTDNFGNVDRSSPSPILTVTTTTNTSSVSLVIPTLRLTRKTKPRAVVSIVVYRTQANGILFNQVTSTIAPLANDVEVDSVTFVDSASDSNIAANPLIYTTGGVLANVSPESNSLCVLYADRVILGGLEDPNQLIYSQPRISTSQFNTTPTNFCLENTIDVDPKGGSITALGVSNGNLIIFKENYIFTSNGSGPNSTGSGTLFPEPQILPGNVGCNNPNSVGVVPQGIMFQSDHGIYLLDTGLNLQPIGLPVQAYNNITITSTDSIPDKNIIVFTTSSGICLVYDYVVNQWSTWVLPPGISPQDAIIYNNLLTFVASDGYVFYNNEDLFNDDGYAISMSFTTPNLKFANISGYQRVYSCFLYGTYKSPHTLSVQVAYDDSPTYDPIPTPITPMGYVAGGLYQYRIDFNQQRCTSIRLNISDSPSAPYGEGYAISALTFVVGALPIGLPVPATQQQGTS